MNRKQMLAIRRLDRAFRAIETADLVFWTQELSVFVVDGSDFNKAKLLAELDPVVLGSTAFAGSK